jgi:hypothetical protein
LCREHGQQLTALAAADVPLWGVVKETSVDDEGLLEFYNKYFPFPLFLDETLSIYQGMGNRKIGLRTLNPFRLWRGFRSMGSRLKEKKIEGNLVGDGMIQGGILVFDKEGKIRYGYEEMVGDELDIDDIRAAIKAVRGKGSEEF